MRLDLFPHPLGEGHRRVEDRAGEQQHELLAAIPAGAVDLANLGAQNTRELLEHRVARLVAIGVVHTLEAIEIAHHAGERLVQPLGVLEHLVDPLLEMPPVIEAGERVRLRHVPQLFIRLHQLALAFLELLLETLDAQHRREPRLQFGEVDGLRDVVVGAGLESLDLVLRRVERRLHDDRNERQARIALDPASDLDAIHHGHHDVEQDQIGRRELPRPASTPRTRPFRSIAVSVMKPQRLQVLRSQQLHVVFMIVDNQDACRFGHHEGLSIIFPEEPLHFGDHGPRLTRLGEVAVASDFHGLFAIGGQRMRGQGDDRDLPRLRVVLGAPGWPPSRR